MNSPQEGQSVFAAWRREAGAVYTIVFALAVLVLTVSFATGFVRSYRLFGMPPIGADATILGQDLFERGEYVRALEEFRLAGLIDPENYDGSPELAFADPQGDVDARVRRQRLLAARRPHDASAHLRLGRALQAAGELAEAAHSLERARDLDARLPELQATLGIVYLVAGRTQEAAQALREAVAAGASQPDLHVHLGLALYQLGKRDEAAREFARARVLREGGDGTVR